MQQQACHHHTTTHTNTTMHRLFGGSKPRASMPSDNDDDTNAPPPPAAAREAKPKTPPPEAAAAMPPPLPSRLRARLYQPGSSSSSSTAATAAPAPPPPPPATWSEPELARGRVAAAAEGGGGGASSTYELRFSAANPTPGTGRTGFTPVPPNNFYGFYGEGERYTPVVLADGGQLSEWRAGYAPASKEQAERDRAAAFAAGVPHGYVDPAAAAATATAGDELLELTVVSDLHDDDEYGAAVGADGCHSGGAFVVRAAPALRVEQLRLLIRDVGGVPPALQRLAFAGKPLDDSQRTLAHYGVAYWHRKFPHWPIVVRRY